MTPSKPLALTGVMIFALGFIGMLGPFGTDVYLPAMPAMAADLHVSAAHVEVVLSAFTIGMAVGQFILGSLSDRFGRRIVLVGGGVISALAALGAANSPNIEVLISLCVLLGLSAAAGIVNGRAVVADLTSGAAATRPFAILGMTVSIGPILGPIGGALLLSLGGWRAIFFGLAIFATLATLGILFFVPESLPTDKRHPGGLKTTFANAKRILSTRSYLTYAVVIWFGFGMMFAYISSSSFIVQTNLGMSADSFAAVFGTNGVGIIITSFLSAQLVKKIAPRRILLVGVCMQVIAVVALAVVIVAGQISAWTILPAMFVLATSMGFIFGPATALAMVEVRFASGTALAIMGGTQFLSAAVAATLIGVVSTNAVNALAIVAGGAVALVVAAVVIGSVSGRASLTRSSIG